jgi:dTMP kinase
VLDRYYFSTIAYQGALQLNPEEIQARNEAFAPPPDLLFLLHLPAAQGLQRVQQRGLPSHFERLDYLERVAAIFATMDFPYLRRIDASADALTVQEHIWQEVLSLLARAAKNNSPVAQEDTA